jgi:hypothetical protein
MVSNASLGYDVMTTLLLSLTPERRSAIKIVTQQLIMLRIPVTSMDAIIAAVILEAAESQFVIDGGTASPKQDVLDVLKPIFAANKQNKKSDNKKN